MSVSAYATPALLGGPTKLIAPEIYDLATGYMAWREASALATLLFAMVSLTVWIATRLLSSERWQGVAR
jgi:ABC-type Fe3+ transport system permease subunit